MGTPPVQQSWSGGKGKGWSGGKDIGKGWGNDGGKGFGKGKRKTDPEKKAWIGGLPKDEASRDRNMALLEHMKQAGDCRFVNIGRAGEGSAVYTSAEEVQNAIAT